MKYFASSIFVILITGVFTGLILKFSDKSFEKYQNKYLLKTIKILNMICSSIILIPFQIMVSLLIILFILMILILLFEKIIIKNEFILLIIFSAWLILMPCFMKFLWKPGKYISNSISDCIKLPESVSEFVGHIFYGKIFIYLLALIFVVLNNLELKIPIINTVIFEEFKKILNSSILIFIAADRIVVGIQNWVKIRKMKNNGIEQKCIYVCPLLLEWEEYKNMDNIEKHYVSLEKRKR